MFGILAAIGSAVVGAIGSAIGSAITSAAGAIASFASSAVGAIKSVGTIAKTVVGAAKTLAIKESEPLLADAMVSFTGRTISKLAKKLKITKEEEKPEIVGYRIVEANNHPEWKPREDFDDFQAFNDYLKQKEPDDSINQDKLNQNNETYRIIGTSALYHEIGVHEDMNLDGEFMVDIGRARITEEEAKAILETFKNLGLQEGDLTEYFKGNMSFKIESTITDALVKAFQKYFPQMHKEEVIERLDDIRFATRGEISNEDIKIAMHRLYDEDIAKKVKSLESRENSNDRPVMSESGNIN